MPRQIRKPVSTKQDYRPFRNSGKSADSASPAGQAQNVRPKEILWAMGAAGRDVLEDRARARRRARELSITVRSFRPGGPSAQMTWALEAGTVVSAGRPAAELTAAAGAPGIIRPANRNIAARIELDDGVEVTIAVAADESTGDLPECTLSHPGTPAGPEIPEHLSELFKVPAASRCAAEGRWPLWSSPPP